MYIDEFGLGIMMIIKDEHGVYPDQYLLIEEGNNRYILINEDIPYCKVAEEILSRKEEFLYGGSYRFKGKQKAFLNNKS